MKLKFKDTKGQRTVRGFSVSLFLLDALLSSLQWCFLVLSATGQRWEVHNPELAQLHQQKAWTLGAFKSFPYRDSQPLSRDWAQADPFYYLPYPEYRNYDLKDVPSSHCLTLFGTHRTELLPSVFIEMCALEKQVPRFLNLEASSRVCRCCLPLPHLPVQMCLLSRKHTQTLVRPWWNNRPQSQSCLLPAGWEVTTRPWKGSSAHGGLFLWVSRMLLPPSPPPDKAVQCPDASEKPSIFWGVRC